jgi:hypothetical protein
MTSVVLGVFIGITMMAVFVVLVVVLVRPHPDSQPTSKSSDGVESAGAPSNFKRLFGGDKKPGAVPDQQPAEEGPAIDEPPSSTPVTEATSPEAETKAVAPPMDQEAPVVEPVSEEEPTVKVINASSAEPSQAAQGLPGEEVGPAESGAEVDSAAGEEVPVAEPVSEEEPTVKVINASSAEPSQAAQGLPGEEAGPAESGVEVDSSAGEEVPAMEPVSETDNDADQEQPMVEGGDDDLSNLFATEIADDDGTGKLAKTMSDVDTQDLIKDAQDLIDQLGG